MAKIEIMVGSVLGASEYVADALSDALAAQGLSATIHLNPEYSAINKNAIWIICTSTHGAGDLPDNIQPFAKQLSQQDLANISFIVIGLGDSSYDTYCYGANTMEKILTQSGANLLCPALHIDVLVNPIPEDIAVQWLNQKLPKITNSL